MVSRTERHRAAPSFVSCPNSVLPPSVHEFRLARIGGISQHQQFAALNVAERRGRLRPRRQRDGEHDGRRVGVVESKDERRGCLGR